MQKYPRLLQWFLAAVLILAALPVAAQRWTDVQMTEYIRQRYEQGVKAEAIAKELVARGAKADQLQRVQRSMRRMAAERAAAGRDGAEGMAADAPDRSPQRLNNGEEYDNPPLPPAEQPDSAALQRRIFGHDIFRSRMLSFEPNVNMAVPDDYRLGPGDEI